MHGHIYNPTCHLRFDTYATSITSSSFHLPLGPSLEKSVHFLPVRSRKFLSEIFFFLPLIICMFADSWGSVWKKGGRCRQKPRREIKQLDGGREANNEVGIRWSTSIGMRLGYSRYAFHGHGFRVVAHSASPPQTHSWNPCSHSSSWWRGGNSLEHQHQTCFLKLSRWKLIEFERVTKSMFWKILFFEWVRKESGESGGLHWVLNGSMTQFRN